MAIFPGEPELANFIEAKDNGNGGVYWSYKLQSNCHHQQINTQIFTGRMPFLSPNQQRQSAEGKCSYTGLLTIKTIVIWSISPPSLTTTVIGSVLQQSPSEHISNTSSCGCKNWYCLYGRMEAVAMKQFACNQQREDGEKMTTNCD